MTQLPCRIEGVAVEPVRVPGRGGEGMTIDAFGLHGMVHVALGALSPAGTLAWWARDALHHAHPEQEETLS